MSPHGPLTGRVSDIGHSGKPPAPATHEYPPGKVLFLSWHLHGSLPSALYLPLGKGSSGKVFVWMDRYLDTICLGPMFLRHEAVARCVVKAIRRGADELGQYELSAYVVMSNHARGIGNRCR